MSDNLSKNLSDVQALVEIVARLRAPNGCPWDREQTHLSLARYAIEEAFEMVEALEEREHFRQKHMAKASSRETAKQSSFASSDIPATARPKLDALTEKFKDELGDVLFQVVLQTQLTEEDQAFDFYDVVRTLSEKLVRRHPHVFSDTTVDGTEDVIKNWEEIKKAERARRAEAAPLIAVPAGLPALQRAHAIGKKTQKMKFDWQGPAEVWLKVKEEIDELQEAMDNDVQSEIEHEIGDVLFSVAQLARHYELEPEQLLRTANSRFLGRFEKMISIYHHTSKTAAAASTATSTADEVLQQFGNLSNEEKEKFWSLAKEQLKTES